MLTYRTCFSKKEKEEEKKNFFRSAVRGIGMLKVFVESSFLFNFVRWGVFDYQIKQRSVGADGSDSGRQKDHAETLEPQNGEVEIGRPVVARLPLDFDLSRRARTMRIIAKLK